MLCQFTESFNKLFPKWLSLSQRKFYWIPFQTQWCTLLNVEMLKSRIQTFQDICTLSSGCRLHCYQISYFIWLKVWILWNLFQWRTLPWLKLTEISEISNCIYAKLNCCPLITSRGETAYFNLWGSLQVGTVSLSTYDSREICNK